MLWSAVRCRHTSAPAAGSGRLGGGLLWVTGDATPGELDQRLHGTFLRHPPLAQQPPARARLGQPDQPHRQQVGLLLGEPGVRDDGGGDRAHALRRGVLHPLPDGRLAAQVGLQDELVRAAGVCDEVEVGPDRAFDPDVVVRGRGERRAHGRDQLLGVLVEQREIEVELAGEVLVEHRLAHPGPLGDLVHRGRVVALGDEHLAGGPKQLEAARCAGEPRSSARPRLWRRGLGCHRRTSPSVTGIVDQTLGRSDARSIRREPSVRGRADMWPTVPAMVGRPPDAGSDRGLPVFLLVVLVDHDALLDRVELVDLAGLGALSALDEPRLRRPRRAKLPGLLGGVGVRDVQRGVGR
ncbi:hypothetical protein FMEAI12_5500011 [Parafrankia sp. Ea1.12]|nr:hypothetical protein FMEAI12_5500011 [Parafrankia sp. Ea1.12]